MSKGPESESKTELPGWYTKWAKKSLNMADMLAQKGYVPYMGPDVAAFNPTQMQGMQAANNMAAAFGKPGTKPVQVAAGMPRPQTFAGGVRGYSSYPLFEQSQKKLKSKFPGLFDYIQSFSINPITGAPSTAQVAAEKKAEKDIAELMRQYQERQRQFEIDQGFRQDGGDNNPANRGVGVSFGRGGRY